MTESARRVLVTGATGSIGSRLAQRLSEAGQRVRVLVRDPSRLQKVQIAGSLDVFQADLGDSDSLRGCSEGCSVVYHCAAKLTGSDWARFRAINVDGTKALLREAERSHVERFVHVSTIGVYACSESQNIDEESPWPKSAYPYFATKQAAEQAAWAAADRVPITTARLGDVFGPGQDVWTMDLVAKIRKGMLLPPTDTESGIFNPVYIGNALDALLVMGEHPAALGQSFNIVDGTPMLFSEYIRRLAWMAGKRTFAVPGIALKAAATVIMGFDLVRGLEASVKPGDVDYLLHKGVISGQKIQSLLGWLPSVSEEDAFCRTEAWLRQQGYLD